MILLRLLVITLLVQVMSFKMKKKFDPNLNKLKGLSCYQCKSSDSHCHSEKFYSSSKKKKLDMLIQCPVDCEYCLKREMWIDSETSQVDRGCSKAVDTLGQKVRAGCMVSEKIEVCLCERNLCNRSERVNVEEALLFAIVMMVILKFISL